MLFNTIYFFLPEVYLHYMYEIIQILSILCFRKQKISLVSLDLIAIIMATRIEDYRRRFTKLISMDFERRQLVQLV